MTIKTRSSDTNTEANSARKVLSRKTKVDAEPVEAMSVSPVVAEPGISLEGLDRPVTGRGVFAVRNIGNAVSVEAAFLAEDGNVLRLPAVFPNREYALAQVDELRALINQHFDGIDQQERGAVPSV